MEAGPSCNLALDIRQLDPSIPIETVGLVGNDGDGRYLREAAAKAGIDISQMAVTDAAATHFCNAYVSRTSHRRTHIFHAGTAALLTPDHFDFSATRMRYLHLGLPGVHRILDAPWNDEPNGWVAVSQAGASLGPE